ncbi:hypothetical protein HDU93_001883, partial [Gonapodya sp. JEL0774]
VVGVLRKAFAKQVTEQKFFDDTLRDDIGIANFLHTRDLVEPPHAPPPSPAEFDQQQWISFLLNMYNFKPVDAFEAPPVKRQKDLFASALSHSNIPRQIILINMAIWDMDRRGYPPLERLVKSNVINSSSHLFWVIDWLCAGSLEGEDLDILLETPRCSWYDAWDSCDGRGVCDGVSVVRSLGERQVRSRSSISDWTEILWSLLGLLGHTLDSWRTLGKIMHQIDTRAEVMTSLLWRMRESYEDHDVEDHVAVVGYLYGRHGIPLHLSTQLVEDLFLVDLLRWAHLELVVDKLKLSVSQQDDLRRRMVAFRGAKALKLQLGV